MVAKSKPDVIGSSVVQLLRKKRWQKTFNVCGCQTCSNVSFMISRVEHELCRPSFDTLLRIADAMEIDLWPLIKQAEQSFRPWQMIWQSEFRFVREMMLFAILATFLSLPFTCNGPATVHSFHCRLQKGLALLGWIWLPRMAARTLASMRSTKLMPTRLNLLAGRIAAAISSAVCFTLLRQRCGVVLMLLSV